jgi:hypothetical protein
MFLLQIQSLVHYCCGGESLREHLEDQVEDVKLKLAWKLGWGIVHWIN